MVPHWNHNHNDIVQWHAKFLQTLTCILSILSDTSSSQNRSPKSFQRRKFPEKGFNTMHQKTKAFPVSSTIATRRYYQHPGPWNQGMPALDRFITGAKTWVKTETGSQWIMVTRTRWKYVQNLRPLGYRERSWQIYAGINWFILW